MHMELDLQFNWEREEVLSTARLQVTPYQNRLDTLSFDARGFDVESVRFEKGDSSHVVSYDYDGSRLHIVSPIVFGKSDTAVVVIDYTARPSKLAKGDGRAITSAQGLYFINPRGVDPNKPRQIWSQGETTYNSGWFPCVDEPHEKFTQELFLTVDTTLQTLSNGTLMYASLNQDGTRTDYWKQDLPHSTYLTMIAIGNWAIHRDEWEGKPVWYYVDKAYEDDAEAIFGNTPEMLSFYSDLLAVPYPWDKYHQVVVEDFVSGAMENTSAVIHGDFVQLTSRELIDESHEDVIAHELFHHWFGDLVTCESWPQITMNEGFATYGEYLWKDYKYGREDARYHLYKDAQRYITDAQTLKKPLIRYRYEKPDDLFDSHSYQKGGLVLHMLRKELGDDFFFAGLTHYLKHHAYGSAEDDDLRQSLESVSGFDLKWFFDDWYHMPGHPEMHISWGIDSLQEALTLSLVQQQDSDEPFRQHADVVIAYSSRIDTHRIWLNDWEEKFTYSLSSKPIWYAVDPEHDLLWDRVEEKQSEIWMAQLEENNTFHTLNDPMQFAIPNDIAMQERKQNALLAIVSNPQYFYESRYRAVEALFELPQLDTQTVKTTLTNAFMQDPSSHVRAVVLFAIDSLTPEGLSEPLIEQALRDTSFKVMRSALSLMLDRDPCRGLAATRQFSDEEVDALISWLSRLHANCGSEASLAFFQKEGDALDGFERFLFNNDFGTYAEVVGTEEVYDAVVKQLGKEALSETSWWSRLAAIQALEKASAFYEKQLDALNKRTELTSDQTEHIAKLRNKKASLSALIEEARELQGEDQQFIED